MINEAKKVLILRLDAIEDIVHTIETYRSIKRTYPDAQIHYVTNKENISLIENDKDLARVWSLESNSYSSIAALALQLKKENFDVFINLQPSMKTRLLSVLTGAKRTSNYKNLSNHHAVKNFWLTAFNVLNKISFDNKLNIHIPVITFRNIKKYGIDNDYVAFVISSSSNKQGRKWPVEYWRELAQIFRGEFNKKIIILGNEEDNELALGIAHNQEEFVKTVCGESNLLETAAILKKVRLVVSGDTGNLHIATAVNPSCIGIFGATDMERRGPVGENIFAIKSNRDCVPCQKNRCSLTQNKNETTPCMYDITPRNVSDIVKEKYFKLETGFDESLIVSEIREIREEALV